MWVMGILIVAGSAFPTWIPFDTWFGVTASVAGVAFGAGLMIAGFDPVGNVSWVRALILYAILQVIYQIFLQISIGRFDIVAFITRGSCCCPSFFNRGGDSCPLRGPTPLLGNAGQRLEGDVFGGRPE